MRKNYIHQNIRQFRHKYNWSQEELAEKCNVDRTVVSKWEKQAGGRVPDLDMIIELSILFDCTLDELILESKKSANILPFDWEATTNEILKKLEQIQYLADASSRESIWKQYKSTEPPYTFGKDLDAEILTDIGYAKLEQNNLSEAEKLFKAALVQGDFSAYIPLLHIWSEFLTIAEDNETSTLSWLASNLKNISDFSAIAREVLYDEYDIKN